MAPWLSMAIGIGGRWLGSFDWGKDVAGAPGGSISASRHRSHVASHAASVEAMYSASHVNRVTIGYLFDPQQWVLQCLGISIRLSICRSIFRLPNPNPYSL
jgi:hypothetical protein